MTTEGNCNCNFNGNGNFNGNCNCNFNGNCNGKKATATARQSQRSAGLFAGVGGLQVAVGCVGLGLVAASG